MIYIFLIIIMLTILLSVTKDIVRDIRNSQKSYADSEILWKDVPKIKTRNMYN